MNKAPGSPLFCQDYNGAFGLAGIHFGGKHGLFTLTGKWRLNFISKVLKNEGGEYRVLWPRLESNTRKKNCGNPSVKISCMILSYFTYLVCKLFWLIA